MNKMRGSTAVFAICSFSYVAESEVSD